MGDRLETMLRSARFQIVLILCLGFILGQAGAACAAPPQSPVHHGAMTGPCPDDGPAPAFDCPMICPLAQLIVPSALAPERVPLSPRALRFSIAQSDSPGLELSPETPPPRAAGAVAIHL